MAKGKFNKRVAGVDSATLATFQGVFGGIVGLGVAILHSLNATVDYAAQTESLLAGMAFGLAVGVVSIIVLPLIYFAFGWITGYLQGFVFNVVAGQSGGIVLRLED